MSAQFTLFTLQKGDIVDNYEIVKQIANGIYLIADTKKQFYAMKLGSNNGRVTLLNEFNIYQTCQSAFSAENKSQQQFIGIPKTFCYGELTDTTNYLVLEYLEHTLLQSKRLFQSKYDLILDLGQTGLNGLRKLHEVGYVHSDIKPENIMSVNASTSWKFIDFGLGQKIPQKNKVNPKGFSSGTPRYASINVHLGHEPTRRDDVESWIYTLWFLYFGSLPWQTVSRNEMLELKTQSLKLFENKFPDSKLINLWTVTTQLRFDQTPNYKI